ncbi:2Fe-2S iron-sulfur cluster-binding protein [Natronobacterium gregoryi]|uniref:Ferredoxin n=2 Tax=Natronobacterium gregoryi TaxID=44930 RepID=L0AHB2_NATGS|nr:2Fe-2S iron-sulfur cluster binding domain-containing protein [Natronobacterium gregoryi]AFZ73288.1 ferredoxin [Natronobacterium gregoryi SP2]ELY73932.1 ferredoxin [Natronobacterium gregoryi SP2]PLK19915.1 ferredoxin [Natronobacterium gregoryi SP2]SFJ38255.1 ferredoxin [Natronobacterium gregoryi]
MTAATTWTVELRVPQDADLEAAGESRTIEVPEDQSILSAARAAGIWLTADCQQGWCITCGARLLEGEVDHSTAKRYYPEDERAGFVLTCVARPRSDCVLEVERDDELLRHRADHDRPPGRSKLD